MRTAVTNQGRGWHREYYRALHQSIIDSEALHLASRDVVFWRDEAITQRRVIAALMDRFDLPAQEKDRMLDSLQREMRAA